jgi:hypothetical protein
MKKLAIIAILLATPAFAEDAPQADKPAEVPASGAPSPPAPAALPPTEWFIRLDQQGINNIAQCSQELPKKIADPFLFNLDAQLKSQAALIAAIKAKP